MLQAALSMTASKWQRAERNDEPGYRTSDLERARAPKGFFKCADERWISSRSRTRALSCPVLTGQFLALRQRQLDNVRR